MFISKNEYERLEETIAELKAELAETKKQYIDIWTQHCRDFLDNYEYAVLLPKDTYTLKVWNKGRFEENVREIEVSQEPHTFPYFKMIK